MTGPGVNKADGMAMAKETMRETTCNHCGYDPGDASETADELSRHGQHWLCDDCEAIQQIERRLRNEDSLADEQVDVVMDIVEQERLEQTDHDGTR